jgi:hypothetical protein
MSHPCVCLCVCVCVCMKVPWRRIFGAIHDECKELEGETAKCLNSLLGGGKRKTNLESQYPSTFTVRERAPCVNSLRGGGGK